jgi:hypothetical protein
VSRPFYFFGTPKVKDEFTLVMGDIDVKKSKGLGSLGATGLTCRS